MSHERDLILKEEVHRIVGCGMEVLNVLGHGFLEKTYENALVVEFGLKEIPGQPQKKFDVILNFKRARLEWKRVVLQKNRE